MNCAKSAKSIVILGHITSGMGERTLTAKFKRALERLGYTVSVKDIINDMGEDYTPLAEINFDLADAGYSMIDDLRSLSVPESDMRLILSWGFSLAALYGAGVFKAGPTATSLFTHHPEEKLISSLYQPASLLITESLLANKRALHYHFDPGKVLCIPHCYPRECETIVANREYVEQLAQQQGKHLGKTTQIIGCVSRLEYGKNCEYAVEAVRQLYSKGKDVVLVLKGYFPEHAPYPEYKPRFLQMLSAYKQEPWLLWDSTQTPYPDVMREYADFDLLLHPSGAEGGSHVVIECLGSLKPIVLLDCSTNPYLFKGVANFVKTTGVLQPGPLPFYIPDLKDLCSVLEGQLIRPDPAQVAHRFHEKEFEQRMPLIFKHEPQEIEELYEYDRFRFGL